MPTLSIVYMEVYSVYLYIYINIYSLFYLSHCLPSPHPLSILSLDKKLGYVFSRKATKATVL